MLDFNPFNSHKINEFLYCDGIQAFGRVSVEEEYKLVVANLI